MKIVNPATEELLQEIPEDSPERLTEKFLQLKNGQKSWQSVMLSQRLAAISVFGELVREQLEELAQLLSREMGKPIVQARREISLAQGRITYFLEHAEKWLSEEWTVAEGEIREKVVYEPLGVVGNISTWNYPYNIGYQVFIPALLAGNAVLYKPSEHTVLTGLRLAELLYKAGVPEDAFQVAIGDGKAGKALLKLPLDAYFFTGSYQTGLQVVEMLAPKLVPYQLELGGKDPLYVAPDVADVRQAAALAVEGKFYNAGQSRSAIERIYVHEAIYKPFVQAFIEETEKLKVGDPLREDTDLGPLASKDQLGFLRFQLNDALDKGATLLLGDEILGNTPGFFFEPTVLVDVNHDMSVMVDETFGPLIGIQQVESDEEAVALMGDTLYGLSASVFSGDQLRAESILAQLPIGTGYWNCCDRVSPTSPWSGRKHSGLGTLLSYQGIRAFVQPKAYHLKG